MLIKLINKLSYKIITIMMIFFIILDFLNIKKNIGVLKN